MKRLSNLSISLLTFICISSILIGCSDESLQEDTPKETTHKKITISVGTDNNASRVSYSEDLNGNPEPLKWGENEEIRMLGYDSNGKYIGDEVFVQTSGSGTTHASFSGYEIEGATTYNIIYPSSSITNIDGDGCVGQYVPIEPQKGDGNTDHLQKTISLGAYPVTNLNNIQLCMSINILKFELYNIPTDVGLLSSLYCDMETEIGIFRHILEFSQLPEYKIIISQDKRSLTAYMPFFYISIIPGGEFSVILNGYNKCYKATTHITNGKTYETGKRYTAIIDGTPNTMVWNKYVTEN